MEWSIQQIAKITGTTSRTLRHYDDIGLLPPSSVGGNGYRHYDGAALVRLQRILLLRDLGLGLPQIAEVIDRETSEEHALEGHLAWLRQEQDRLARQIVSVESTITTLKGGERLMAENMFDGFDHTQYKDEVEAALGKEGLRRQRPLVARDGCRGEGGVEVPCRDCSARTGSRRPSGGSTRPATRRRRSRSGTSTG